MTQDKDRFKLVIGQTQRPILGEDREYQFFKDLPLSVPHFTDPIVAQKMDYIPCYPIQPKGRLAAVREAYSWSSAGFYLRAEMHWDFLKHFWYGCH